MLRLPFCEIFKQLINLVLVILVILPHLHLIEQINERGEVLLFLRQLIVDIPDQGDVQQRFGLDPKIITTLAFAFGIGDESGDELQNICFAAYIRKRVKVHGFSEVDRVENTKLITGCDQHLAALNDQRPLGIGDDQRGSLRLCALHNI